MYHHGETVLPSSSKQVTLVQPILST